MPIINILFWATLVLASIVLWKIYVYMATAEEEAERQYELLIMEEHMYDMRLKRPAESSSQRSVNNRSSYNYVSSASYDINSRNRVEASGVEHSDGYRQPKHRRGHRTVA